MSAETLRKAAALMRERAEAATPGPWVQHTAIVAADTVIFDGVGNWVTNLDNCPAVGEHQSVPGGSICSDQAAPNGDHIASWHPAVALAVADWLEDAAENAEMQGANGDLREHWDMRVHIAAKYALAVATAYLGADA